MSNAHTIRVLFLRAEKDDHWINRLVSWIDPPFCHVEIEFECIKGQLPHSSTGGAQFTAPSTQNHAVTIASSVFSGDTVFLRPRTFANPNYTVLSFLVNQKQFERMYKFCEFRVNTETGFDETAMCCAMSPCLSRLCLSRSYPETQPRTFCSEHVTLTLQAGGIDAVRDADARHMTPSRLHKLLTSPHAKIQRCFSTVNFKMNLMEKQGII